MDTSITYIHKKSPSFLSQMFQTFMVLYRMKDDIERRMKKQKFSQKAAALPGSLKNKCNVQILERNGRQIWIVKPKNNASEKVIFYLHGGAYIFNISKYHWNFIEQLVLKTKATVVVPDYPLVPVANCTGVYKFIEAAYDEFFAELLPENIVFMGDSAGAGIAFGFAQELRNKNKIQPSQIILVSPWLDVTMSNSSMKKIDKKDKILGIQGLQMVGEAYADKGDKKDFRVSPIYGNFSGMGKISIFTGTNEVFIADVKKLKDQLNKENIQLNYFEYPKMFHVWAIFTQLEESRDAIDKITSLLNN